MISFPVSIIVPETRAICKSDRASFLFSRSIPCAEPRGTPSPVLACNRFDWPTQCQRPKPRPYPRGLCLCPRRTAKRAAALVVAQKRQRYISALPRRLRSAGGFLGLRPRVPRPSPAARAPPTPCRRRSVALLRRSLTDKNETHPLLGAAFRLYGRAVLAFLRLKSLESGQKRAVFVLAAALPRLLPPVAPLRLLVGLFPALRADGARQARPYCRQSTKQTADQRPSTLAQG